MEVERLYPKAYLEFLTYFHGSRDYFECHEVLEEYWKDAQGGDKDTVWVGLIQIAVSLYHYRRKNYLGAKRMLKNAINISNQTEQKLLNLAIDPTMLKTRLAQLLKNIEQENTFYDIELPITDDQLLQQCERACLQQGFSFGAKSDLINDHLVHKHKLRDRQDVLSERQQRLDEKKRRRFAD